MSVTKEDVDSAKAYVKNFKALPAEERKHITKPFLQRLIDHGIIQDTNYYKKYLDRLPSSVNGLSRINSASNNAILESGREAPYVQEIAVQRPDFC